MLCSAVALAQTPAFPGAEGFGRNVTGGRGGTVIHVTNLNNSGTGSLRAAVSGSSKKIVVFDVSGIIELQSDLSIGDNTTIEGQTAPYPGITLRYRTVRPGNNNIIRFIRVRRGEEKDVNDGADAIWNSNKQNLILDHCSFSWSIDEIASFYDNLNFTMQWCTLGEALANAGHTKNEHSFGGIWGGKNASFHHNFIAHVQNRAPRFCGARYNWAGYDQSTYGNTIQAERVDFRNCVMYNWGNGNGCYGGTGGGQINIVNNYYKAGPATVNKTRVTQVSVATSDNASGSPFMGYASRYYINGNYVTAAGRSAENYDWKGVIYDNGLVTINGEKYIPDADHKYGESETYEDYNGTACIRVKMDNPIETGTVTTHTAQTAFQKVLGNGGASLFRDAVDARYMDEAENGTTTYIGTATQTGTGGSVTHRPGIIDFVRDQGTYELESNVRSAEFDADNDGMADEWETANGGNLTPGGYDLDPRGWYTNIEVYCNSLVEDIMKDGNADAETPVDEYYPECVMVDVNGNTPDDPIEEEGTSAQIVWNFNTGAAEAAVITSDVATSITSDNMTLGSLLKYGGTRTVEGVVMTQVTNNDGQTHAEPVDGNTITYEITMAENMKFMPTNISFYASRIGTDHGSFDAYWENSEGTRYEVAPGQAANRNNEAGGFYTLVNKKMSNVKATSGTSRLIIHAYDIPETTNTKYLALANIQINGKVIENTTAISNPTGNGIVKSVRYYNLQGQEISKPGHGVCIVVTTMNDGKKNVKKQAF